MVKFVNKVMGFVEIVLTVLMGVASSLVVAQVFWRYILNSPLGWTEQICRLTFGWMVMLGIPAIFNRGVTMAFDILQEHMKGNVRFVVQVVIQILGLAFSVFYFVASMQLCMSAVGRMTSGVKMPQNMLYGAQPIGAALLFLVLAKQLIELLQNHKHPADSEAVEDQNTEEGE